MYSTNIISMPAVTNDMSKWCSICQQLWKMINAVWISALYSSDIFSEKYLFGVHCHTCYTHALSKKWTRLMMKQSWWFMNAWTITVLSTSDNILSQFVCQKTSFTAVCQVCDRNLKGLFNFSAIDVRKEVTDVEYTEKSAENGCYKKVELIVVTLSRFLKRLRNSRWKSDF